MTEAPVVAARRKFFGAAQVDARTGEVDPGRVVLSWFGVTGYAVAMRGHVFLLDAWVPRGAHSGYVPTTPVELACLRPEAVFLGHGHFDHAADAAEIAVRSGATVVGTQEHCAQVRRQAGAAGHRVRTHRLGTPADALGTVYEPRVLDRVGVTAVRHLHSAVGPKDRSAATGSRPLFLRPSPSTVLRHPPRPRDAIRLLRHLADKEGGSLLYQLHAPGFRLTWHDTSGPLADRAPHVLELLRGMPPSDVQVGAVQGFNQYVNGLRDPRTYVEAVRPRIFVPSHHDDWAAGFTTPGERYRAPLTAELARIPRADRPEIRFTADPGDYLRPGVLTFPSP